MFKFKGSSKGVPQPTNLYFRYHNGPWTLIGTFNSKYAAKLYAYEHGHIISDHDITWRIEPTHTAAARHRYDAEKQRHIEERHARLRQWIAQQWYNFYTEKYSEDCLK